MNFISFYKNTHDSVPIIQIKYCSDTWERLAVQVVLWNERTPSVWKYLMININEQPLLLRPQGPCHSSFLYEIIGLFRSSSWTNATRQLAHSPFTSLATLVCHTKVQSLPLLHSKYSTFWKHVIEIISVLICTETKIQILIF